MSGTTLEAEKAIIFISEVHKNSTIRNLKISDIRTCTIKYLYIVLVSAMTREKTSKVFMILRQTA